ncbi:hypothetical protein Tco_1202502 [Tanacetum coccineum]
MVYTGDDDQEVFMSHARAPLVQEFILEFFSICKIGSEMGLDVAGLHTAEEMAEDEFGAYWLRSERVIPDKGDLSDYWVEISSGRDFLRGAPSYTYIRDPVQRLCHSIDRGAANVPYLLLQYLFRHAEGRKSDARLSRGHFIGHLAHHFGLVSDYRLRGLSIVTYELPLIDMGELVKLNICMEIGDDCAWVALGPERQPDATTGAPRAAKDAPAVNEGRLRPHMMISCMMHLIEASGQTYQGFDGTFRGSSLAIFERRTRQRTSEASTSVAPQQPDP